jgi:hypothetical protein
MSSGFCLIFMSFLQRAPKAPMRRDDHGVEVFSRSLITHNGVRPVSARTVDWRGAVMRRTLELRHAIEARCEVEVSNEDATSVVIGPRSGG